MTYIKVNTIFIKKYIKGKVTIKPALLEEILRLSEDDVLIRGRGHKVKGHYFGTGG